MVSHLEKSNKGHRTMLRLMLCVAETSAIDATPQNPRVQGVVALVGVAEGVVAVLRQPPKDLLVIYFPLFWRVCG